MSQIIGAQNMHGIVLAAESRAIQLNERGEEVRGPFSFGMITHEGYQSLSP